MGVELHKGASTSCGCFAREVLGRAARRRRGPANPRWKPGERRTKSKGYVLILDRGTNKWTVEHRLVMEKILGRPLFPDETVHHKNGIRDDNRPENLELHASSHGRGQTISDLVAWAKEILARYGS